MIIEVPGVGAVEFPDDMPMPEIEAALAQYQAAGPPAPPPPETGIIDQAGSGVNEGLASFLGTPVDAMAGVINNMRPNTDVYLPLTGDGGVGEPEITYGEPTIKDPFGGSGTFRKILDPLISKSAPQTAGQRYARRIGQEVGYGVPASLLGARLPGMGPVLESPGAYAGASLAGDVGAGVAGQTSREILPESDTADTIATLIGGFGGASGASMTLPKYGAAPTLDDVKAKAGDKWRAVEGSGVKLTPQAEAEYIGKLGDRLKADRATNTSLFPRANATLDDITTNPNRSLYGIEEDRRLVGRNVAKDANEARVGVGMKQEIDDYLKSLDASKVQGANPEQAVQDAIDARALTHRTKKAESVLNKGMRGESRAATSGTGGNEVNAKRQNIRALLDIERDPTMKGRKQGFTPEEVAQMGKVVFGSKPQNVARMLGRMAPSSGALPMMATGIGGASGATAALMTGNPLMAAPAIAGGVGTIAKQAAERMTSNEIKKLTDMILNGAPLPKSASSTAAKRAIVEQLLSGSAQKMQAQ